MRILLLSRWSLWWKRCVSFSFFGFNSIQWTIVFFLYRAWLLRHPWCLLLKWLFRRPFQSLLNLARSQNNPDHLWLPLIDAWKHKNRLASIFIIILLMNLSYRVSPCPKFFLFIIEPVVNLLNCVGQILFPWISEMLFILDNLFLNGFFELYLLDSAGHIDLTFQLFGIVQNIFENLSPWGQLFILFPEWFERLFSWWGQECDWSYRNLIAVFKVVSIEKWLMSRSSL